MKSKMMALATVTAAATLLAASSAIAARDQIRIVGSSTVYPFTTAVAEEFGKAAGKTPVVESTGTGGGMKIFCEGVGEDKPDATNASRRMKKSEFETCAKSGVTEIVELKVGFDGLTLAHSKDGKPFALTLQQIFMALAKEVPDQDGKLVANPYMKWSDIDASLPDVKIEVLGPPPTSGTRDSLHELFLEAGAKKFEGLAKLAKDDAKAFEKAWKSVREDGAYVEAGENDNVIVQKLEANKDAVGVFGFSFLEENSAKLTGIALDGAEPTYDNIASGAYKGGRPLYIYFKKQHVGVIAGLKEFAEEYVSDKALGEEGYLAAKGLVALPEDMLKAERDKIAAWAVMSVDELK